ncbi:NLR family CARD domain-containing protein 3-like isoform X2 [Sardina pilchardus]|uniref:NLR family CARD domain-containing protein 3-like isoform X2 n=1 Tax=Sardina pilchardus TaxID=27697 RepID=UPI002E1073C9
MDQPSRLRERHSPAHHRSSSYSVPTKRPVSPVPSCVSMKSDNSMDQPPYLGEGHSPASEGCPHQRPVSPVPSCVSMKSDSSMVQPLSFKDHAATIESPVQQMRSPSPEVSCVSMKSGWSMDQPPKLGEGHYPTPHRGPIQRPVSPVPSCVSMKSDNSIDQPPKLGDGYSPGGESCPHQRPVSPVPSYVSMKSDNSIDQPPKLGEGHSPAGQRGPIQRPVSPVPSCVSMKSDNSIDQPPKLGDGHSPGGESCPHQRPVSPVPSCVSMKSDYSMVQPPKLEDGHSPDGQSCPHQRPVSPVPSCVSMKSDNSMVQPPKLEDGHSPDGQSCPHQRPVSSVPSCVSMKSDNSMVQPPKLEDGHSPGGQSFQTDVDSCTSDHDLTMTSPDTSYHESEEEDLTENRSDFTFSEKIMQDKLKSHLRTKLQHVFKAPSNPVLLSDIYTELYITEGDMGEVNNEHEVREIEAASRGDTESTPIKCSDIFKPLPAQCKTIRTVLTKGIAGIGKTVCVQKFALDWAEGTDNQDIKYIFPLSFRELNLLKAKEFSLLGLLKHFVGEFESVPVLEAKQYEVLLIFDGLDECRLPLAFEENEKCKPATAATAASVDVLLTHLIQGHLLPSALIWITSRPAAAGRILKDCVDRVTAVRGFGDPQKKEYFRKRIRSQTLADKVITHIESLRSLHIMCHIPVFCWISAAVLERLFEEEEVSAIPKNLTQMYTHFLVVQTDTKKKYKERKETDEEMIFKLGKLAFQQLEMGNLIFYEEDLKKCDIDVKEASVYSGVCTQIFREECGLYQGKVFCFVHLSIQEFLAALYVLLSHFYSKESEGLQPGEKNSNLVSLFTAPTLSELQITAVDKALQQPNGSLDLFVRFLLGLCFSAHQPDQTILQVFLPHIRSTSSSNADVIEYIKTRIQINQSPEPSINLFHCLNELNDHSLVEEIQKYQSSRSLSKVTLTPGLWSALVFVLLTSDSSLEVFDLGKYTTRPSDKSLFRMRPVLRESRKAELASCNLTENSCGTLATVISSPNSRLRELDLSDNTIQDTGVALLSRGIEKSSCKLEKLSLSCCGIGRSGCESLLSAILRNPSHLTSIDLSHNCPEHNGMILLSTVLQNQQCRINKLMLINCSISHNSCQLLAMALSSKNSSLRYLDLSGNQIENSGVSKLSQGLKNSNCKLNSLRLSNCIVGERGCRDLASALASNPGHLEELHISHNQPGDLGSKELQALNLKELKL